MLGRLLEIERQVRALPREALGNKIRQWVRRIEQFEALGKEARARALFKELKVMVRIYTDLYKPETKEGILSSQFQGQVLSEDSIEAKLARYYERFSEEEETGEENSTSEARTPATEEQLRSDAEGIRKQGYSLTILKALAGSNPVSEKSLGGFPKLEPKGEAGNFPKLQRKEDELGSLGNFPKLRKKGEETQHPPHLEGQ